LVGVFEDHDDEDDDYGVDLRYSDHAVKFFVLEVVLKRLWLFVFKKEVNAA
jgi:hypothetical protein